MEKPINIELASKPVKQSKQLFMCCSAHEFETTFRMYSTKDQIVPLPSPELTEDDLAQDFLLQLSSDGFCVSAGGRVSFIKFENLNGAMPNDRVRVALEDKELKVKRIVSQFFNQIIGVYGNYENVHCPTINFMYKTVTSSSLKYGQTGMFSLDRFDPKTQTWHLRYARDLANISDFPNRIDLLFLRTFANAEMSINRSLLPSAELSDLSGEKPSEKLRAISGGENVHVQLNSWKAAQLDSIYGVNLTNNNYNDFCETALVVTELPQTNTINVDYFVPDVSVAKDYLLRHICWGNPNAPKPLKNNHSWSRYKGFKPGKSSKAFMFSLTFQMYESGYELVRMSVSKRKITVSDVLLRSDLECQDSPLNRILSKLVAGCGMDHLGIYRKEFWCNRNDFEFNMRKHRLPSIEKGILICRKIINESMNSFVQDAMQNDMLNRSTNYKGGYRLSHAFFKTINQRISIKPVDSNGLCTQTNTLSVTNPLQNVTDYLNLKTIFDPEFVSFKLAETVGNLLNYQNVIAQACSLFSMAFAEFCLYRQYLSFKTLVLDDKIMAPSTAPEALPNNTIPFFKQRNYVWGRVVKKHVDVLDFTGYMDRYFSSADQKRDPDYNYTIVNLLQTDAQVVVRTRKDAQFEMIVDSNGICSAHVLLEVFDIDLINQIGSFKHLEL